MTFEIPGFSRLVRENVRVETDFNAVINAQLRVSQVQETVTVSGAAPGIDTRSTTTGQTFTREMLERIPSARDPGVVLEQTGIVMNQQNVGGNKSGQQSTFIAHGTGNNEVWNVDGQHHRHGVLVFVPLFRLRCLRRDSDSDRRKRCLGAIERRFDQPGDQERRQHFQGRVAALRRGQQPSRQQHHTRTRGAACRFHAAIQGARADRPQALQRSLDADASANFQSTTYDYGEHGVAYQDPTDIEKLDGAQTGTANARWTGKVSGLYVLPWQELGVSAFLNMRQGYPFNRVILTPSRTGGIGTVNVEIDRWGDARLDNFYQLDMRVEKQIPVGRMRWALSLDVFNLLNAATVLARQDVQNSTTANNVDEVLAPRVARIGVRFSF